MKTFLHFFKNYRIPTLLFCAMLIGFQSQAQYCVATNQGGSQITNVTIQGTSLNNTTAASPAPFYYTSYPPAGTTTATLSPGITYQIDLSFDATAISSVWIDYNQDFVYDASEWVQVTTNATSGSANLVVPVTAVPGTTGMRVRSRNGNLQNGAGDACLAMGSGETEDYTVTIVPLTACSGNPVAGTASAPASVCQGQNFVITSSGFTTGTGIIYQWEESPANAGTWSSIAAATGPSYLVAGGITAATDYRLNITCNNGGASDISNEISVGISPFSSCYCSPLTGTTLHTYSYNYIDNVSITGTTLNSSNPTVGSGGYIQLSPAISSNTATLTQGVTYNMENTMIGSGYTSEVWIDYDQSGTFDASEFISLSSSSGANNTSTGIFTIPYTATPGITGMRVRANYNPFGAGDACYDPTYDGETEDYIITIDAALPCAGMPVGGTASGPASVCPSTPFNIFVTGITTGLGIDVQWEESPVGAGTWTDVTGATNNYFNHPGITSPADFRVRVTCANGGAVDYSSVITVNVNPFYNCYCSPLTGTTLHTYSYNYVDNVSITGTSLNSSNPTVGPGGYLQLDPTISSNTATLTQGVTYNMSNTMTGTGYTSEVWIDFDQNGVFDASEFIGMSAAGIGNISSGIITIPYTATPGLTGMRVRANYNSFGSGDACYDPYYDGETEDYIITIDAALLCAGSPTGGTASGPAGVCASSPFTLSTTGTTTGIGIDVQWEESPVGAGSWTDITGATNNYYNHPGITSATDFRLRVTCANGGGVDYSNILSIGMNPFYSCYCSPLTGTTLHTYSYNYVNNVTILGTTLNSSNPSVGPGGYLQLDPNIATNTAHLMQTVPYTMSNTMTYSGYTSEVWIDYDQNGVFDASEFIPMSAASGSGNISGGSIVIPVTALTGQTGMRVRANYYSFGSGDACYDPYYDGETEDYVITIDPALPCSGTPTAGTLSAPSAVCPTIPFVLSLSGYTTGLNIEIQWQESAAGAGTWNNITGATDPFYNNPGITSPMDYQAVITCTNGGGSSTSNMASVTVNSFLSCYCSPLTGVILHIAVDDFMANAQITGTTLNSSNGTNFTTGYTQVPPTPVSNTADLNQGDTYTFNGTGGSAGSPIQAAMWIDWDQSGTFDVSEMMPLTITSPFTATFTVPLTATPGQTGMRVRLRGGNFTTSCEQFGSGETEDYIVNITSNPLAIALKNISAVNVGQRNRVDWTTASEQKGDYFIVERSADGHNFNRVGEVTARDAASGYSFWDQTPVAGINYYRLNMMGASGTSSYSKVVTATVQQTTSFVVEAYPNPVMDQLTVTAYGQQGNNASVSICDVTGKVLRVVGLSGTSANISMSSMAPGVYLVKYSDSDHSQTIKVNKQ